MWIKIMSIVIIMIIIIFIIIIIIIIMIMVIIIVISMIIVIMIIIGLSMVVRRMAGSDIGFGSVWVRVLWCEGDGMGVVGMGTVM